MHKEARLVGEAIRRIEEAERHADDSLRQARAKGKKTIADAHEDVERLLDEMRTEARAEETRLVEQAKTEAEREAVDIVEDSKAAVLEARSAGEAKIAIGVDKVLEFITSTG